MGCFARPPAEVLTVQSNVDAIGPRCVGVRSCLLVRVVSADEGRPLPMAAVFLERQSPAAFRLQRLTDEQGVLAAEDVPQGRYRVAVYKDAMRFESRGIRLGETGTTLIWVRLASPR